MNFILKTIGIKTEIYPAICTHPETKGFTVKECYKRFDSLKIPVGYHMWEYHYKPRNIQNAVACDILYDIEPAGSCKHCKGTGITEVNIYDKFGCPDGIAPEPCPKCEGDGSYSGGTFTLKEARKRGKEVHKVIIE